MFKTIVSVSSHPRINDWLTRVESEMKVSLAQILGESVAESALFEAGIETSERMDTFITWLDKYQTQLICLTEQINWCARIDRSLGNSEHMRQCLQGIESVLNVLADCVLRDQPALRRKKLEHLVSRGRLEGSQNAIADNLCLPVSDYRARASA
jgi:dynein heavy chain 1